METKISLWLSLFISSILLLPLMFHPASANFSPFGFFQDLQGSKKGDNVEGISKVRAYLQRFGYINSTHPTTGTDDHFDEALESAIKKFQDFYNLEPTGIMDAPTTSLMSKPRCGVPDFPPATDDIISSQSHGHSHNHSHLKISPQFVFFPGNPRWPSGKRRLIYLLNTATHPETADAVASAVGAWAAVSPFTFDRTPDPNVADLSMSFQFRDHGDGSPFDGAGGIQAHSFSPTDGRMHLDGEETWVLGVVPGAIDLLTICTHEIGHLLGLAHTPVQEAIMYAYTDPGTRRGIAQDDIDGITALYAGQ